MTPSPSTMTQGEVGQLTAELTALLPRLTALLRQENEALARRCFPDVAALAADKAKLSLAYERLTRRLALAPVEAIAANARARLRQLGSGLAEAAATNERRLAVAWAAHRHLMAAIADAARAARPNAGGYGRGGIPPTGRRGGGLPPPALSLDRAC